MQTEQTAAIDTTPLPLRGDTMLGACEALGQDFGFNPNWLRIVLGSLVLWNAQYAVVDVNDIGGSWVLGSVGIDDPKLIEEILRDNPLGQKDEQTPFGLIRVENAGEISKQT